MKGKKKLLQQRVFVFGHPAKYEPRRTGLNFVQRTRRSAVLVVLKLRVYDGHIIFYF